MIGLLKRRVACAAEFGDMCVPVQLHYLKSGCCRGLKPDADRIRALDTVLRAQWIPNQLNYFEPKWLKDQLGYEQANSATFEIDRKAPVETLYTAVINLDFNKPVSPSEFGLRDKKSFLGTLLVLNKKTGDSHAIGLRKSGQQYFLHDIFTQSTTETAIDGLDCKEYQPKSDIGFRKLFNAFIKQYLAQGFSELRVIEFTAPSPMTRSTEPIRWLKIMPAAKHGTVGPLARHRR